MQRMPAPYTTAGCGRLKGGQSKKPMEVLRVLLTSLEGYGRTFEAQALCMLPIFSAYKNEASAAVCRIPRQSKRSG